MRAKSWILLASLALLLPAHAGEVKTSKERLGDKWSDEQRVDNCRVPPERRGPKPRPDCDQHSLARSPAPPAGTGR
jgi:hypothetical protein